MRELPFNHLDLNYLESTFPCILAQNCHFCSHFSWTGQYNKGKGEQIPQANSAPQPSHPHYIANLTTQVPLIHHLKVRFTLMCLCPFRTVSAHYSRIVFLALWKTIFSCSLTLVFTISYCRNPVRPSPPTPFDSVTLLIWKISTMTGKRDVGCFLWLVGFNWNLWLVYSGKADAHCTFLFLLLRDNLFCCLHWVLCQSVPCCHPWRKNWRFCLYGSAPLLFPPVVTTPQLPPHRWFYFAANPMRRVRG